MTVPTLSELFTPWTTDGVVSQSLSVASSIGLPVTSWPEVSAAREIIYVNAENVSLFSLTTSAIAASKLLDYASGDWLTLTASQVWDTDRIEATYATGSIRLTNSTATPHTFASGAVRVVNSTAGGATYTSTTGGTLAAMGTLTLSFSADQPGTASNLTSGDTLALVTAIPGVTPVYVADLIGADRESDPLLVTRCRLSNASITPNGPRDAYDWIARSATRTDGTAIGVTRTNTVRSNAHVDVYVADADGVVTGPDVARIQELTDLQVVPTGFTASIFSATTKLISISMTLTKSLNSTSTNAEIEARITAAVTNYFSAVDVGGAKSSAFKGVYLSTLILLARDAGGEDVINVVITGPASDTALTVNEVPVISGTINYTWS